MDFILDLIFLTEKTDDFPTKNSSRSRRMPGRISCVTSDAIKHAHDFILFYELLKLYCF